MCLINNAKLPCASNNLRMQNTQGKADLQKMKVNTTKIAKVHADEINFVLGKNGGHGPVV